MIVGVCRCTPSRAKDVSMKSNFALSLSYEGIRLLHRAAGGWRVVGAVPLNAPDLAGDLATLRTTAARLESSGLRTKVLLPNEQIKYLTVDTPDMNDAARVRATKLALDGATPYGVDALAFDTSPDGARTHVAAVAHETLAEAEAFAVEHNFNPISFAAIPGDHPYLGEPFFGPTAAARAMLGPDEAVEPDGIAVVVIGDVAVPDGPVVETADDTPVAAAKDVAPEKMPPPELEPTAKAPAIEPAPDLPPKPEPTPAEPTLAEPVAFSAAPAPAEADAPDLPPQDKVAQEAPAPAPEAPQTQSDMPTLPSLGGARRTAQDTTPAPAAAPTPPAIPSAGFASRRSADAAPARGAARKEPALKTAPPAAGDTPGSVTAADIPIASDGPSRAPVAARTATPAPAPKPPAAKTGFLSRRKQTVDVPQAANAAAVAVGAARSEAERMTVFGARRDVGGKPRFLGLMLTAALLVFLAGVAAWASVFLDDGINLSRLFGERAAPQTAQAPAEEPGEEPAEAEVPNLQTAALDAGLTSEDTAVLDALSTPTPPQTQSLSDAEMEARYAATGIWPRAPETAPRPAGLVPLEDLYQTSIDPSSAITDAVALPPVASFETDQMLEAPALPPTAGTKFALDARGLIIPTAAGSVTPDGFTVFLGAPPLIPPVTPTRFQSEPEESIIREGLAEARPRPRPADLIETTQRAQLDGLTRTELAGYRPSLRPPSVQEQAAAAAAPAPAPPPPTNVTPEDTSEAVAAALAAPPAPPAIENATEFATTASVRPDTRPRNFARIVRRAERAEPQQETRVASAATIAPRTVTPSIPSTASVARQATVKNAINLRKVNLIGVYGKPSSRRALVRLSNGRYKKVVVGDRLDGGRVSAIGDGELRYTRRGRSVVLKMPR